MAGLQLIWWQNNRVRVWDQLWWQTSSRGGCRWEDNQTVKSYMMDWWLCFAVRGERGAVNTASPSVKMGSGYWWRNGGRCRFWDLSQFRVGRLGLREIGYIKMHFYFFLLNKKAGTGPVSGFLVLWPGLCPETVFNARIHFFYASDSGFTQNICAGSGPGKLFCHLYLVLPQISLRCIMTIVLWVKYTHWVI